MLLWLLFFLSVAFLLFSSPSPRLKKEEEKRMSVYNVTFFFLSTFFFFLGPGNRAFLFFFFLIECRAACWLDFFFFTHPFLRLVFFFVCSRRFPFLFPPFFFSLFSHCGEEFLWKGSCSAKEEAGDELKATKTKEGYQPENLRVHYFPFLLFSYDRHKTLKGEGKLSLSLQLTFLCSHIFFFCLQNASFGFLSLFFF